MTSDNYGIYIAASAVEFVYNEMKASCNIYMYDVEKLQNISIHNLSVVIFWKFSQSTIFALVITHIIERDITILEGLIKYDEFDLSIVRQCSISGWWE